MTRPFGCRLVHSGGAPLGLHVVSKAAGVSSVRLPLSSVEPVYGLDPDALVGKAETRIRTPGNRSVQPRRRGSPGEALW